MDSLITAAARALAAGDPLGALKRVALRDDAPALALRGIAMAQLGDLDRALAGLYRHGRRRLLASALVHSVAWATGALEIYLVLHWLGTPASLGTALIIESFAGGVKFASFMVPASLGALEGGYVAFFEAFGLTATAGLSFVLVRRLREMVWAGLGFLALGVSRRAHGAPRTDEPAA